MNVVRCIERLFDRDVGIEKIVCQIEDSHFRVTVDLQWIEGIVGLFDVFVEGFSGCMARQDLRQDDVRFRELVSNVGHTHLYPFGGSFDARLRHEEHVVVADHHDHQARFEAFDAAVIEPPHRRQMLIRLTTWSAIMLGFVDDDSLFMVRASGLESFVLDRSPRAAIVYRVFLAPLRPCVFAFISSSGRISRDGR